ncbi:MAG: transporter substrate-binding domain-containing protein [Pseudomonadota bacterium]
MVAVKSFCLRMALVLMCAGAALACHAEERKSFVIGVENLQYFPLHSTTSTGEFSGYARDVLDAFAQEQGYSFKYLPLPINRLFTVYLGETTLDFKYPDNPNWQAGRRKGMAFTYSTPIVASEEGAMVLPQHKGRPLKRARTLGTVLGFTPWPFMPAIESKAISVTTSSAFDGLLRHALAGHIDAVYVNVDVANYLLAEELKAPGGLVFDPGLPHGPSDFSLSTRLHPQVIAQFNLFLQRQRPLLQQLRAKYKIADSTLN